jgi:outer membrane protein assembly factor BamE (lipoprotein component of BamABCDE complex)
MRALRGLVLMLGALLSLLGCDRTGELRPGISTTAEVIEKMGQPTMEWQEGPNKVWEYPFTPEGTRNYKLTIGPDGILKAMEQMLTPENFAKAQPGMTREQIRRLLGKPATVQFLEQTREEVWEWKETSPRPGSDMRFNVYFSNTGQVTHTGRHEIPGA